MSTSAIELSNNRPLLWLDRARELFNGIGYVTAVGVILACLWTLEETLPEIFAGQLRLATAHFVGGVWQSLVAQIPGPLLIPIAVNLAPRSGVRRIPWLLAAAVPMALWCLYYEGATHSYSWDARSVANLMEGLLTTSLVVGVCAYHSHSRGAADALLRTQIDRTSLDAELQRAHLKLLHAQIEPHFLFNSLSAVRALARIDRSGAVEMLDNLIRYFEAALPRLREEDVPLAQEMHLIDAYLGIFRVRMGKRLAYEVALPKNLETLRVPSMMLLTLVENALKHGMAMMVFLNGRSAARMLAGVRATELERVQVERRLLSSRVAAAEARIDPGLVLKQLAEIRDSYAAARSAADAQLENLIADLRRSVTQEGARGGPRTLKDRSELLPVSAAHAHLFTQSAR